MRRAVVALLGFTITSRNLSSSLGFRFSPNNNILTWPPALKLSSTFTGMANFEKFLTEVDVKKQMAIPSHFVQHLPNYEGGYTIYFPVHDVSGKIWEGFGYYIRSRDCVPYYPKPVFQGDWRKYVREKQLTPGDNIVFRVEENADNGAPRYRIAAQKKIILFGHVIWTEEF